ncbi:MAG TPA: DmsC/YnfH family molybdoenzyme membrane anchor subunit [Polyangiaceae bacterium]|nr:DmsC/YnfH family molybdoenzyme membrane anchor subunit [Polyangiaceae bacterium]
MSSAVMNASLPRVEPAEKPKRKLPVLSVAKLLDAQQTLTAVERFARQHDADDFPRNKKYYEDLIPLERPKPGEQYAFQVDLDACTGCKACVTACHSLNGLDESELWRTTGLLHGGLPTAPAQQTVTTSCHHCLEPACMHGCPTRAYEKDPITGIVKHLDDQCFGCQYCTLMCPYDAPKYNAKLGIVRKCDMCQSRLAQNEAPACVQACPNEAISIQIVDQETVVQRSDANGFLPGAPTPEHTMPTTLYKSNKPLPTNMLPADFYAARPEHSHFPLVVMLTGTQLAVGAFCLELFVSTLTGKNLGNPLFQAIFGCGLAFLALTASFFHLGRPLLAWRAVLGLRTSWMSREVLALGLFAKLALLQAGLRALPLFDGVPFEAELLAITPMVQVATALAGLLGVLCSVMVYVATRRAQWSGARTGIKFFGTTTLLGAAAVFAVAQFGTPAGLVTGTTTLLWFVVAASFVKLTFEASGLLAARDRQNTVFKRMARVTLGDLRPVTTLRFLFGVLGGLALPCLLLAAPTEGAVLATLGLGVLGCVLAGEAAERYLFFRAAPASRMPGGLK